jgi:hypothetical protein
LKPTASGFRAFCRVTAFGLSHYNPPTMNARSFHDLFGPAAWRAAAAFAVSSTTTTTKKG